MISLKEKMHAADSERRGKPTLLDSVSGWLWMARLLACLPAECRGPKLRSRSPSHPSPLPRSPPIPPSTFPPNPSVLVVQDSFHWQPKTTIMAFQDTLKWQSKKSYTGSPSTRSPWVHSKDLREYPKTSKSILIYSINLDSYTVSSSDDDQAWSK